MAELTFDDNPNTKDGTPADDRIKALGGNDRIDGLEGNDTIEGGTGFDNLFGNLGNDLLFGDEQDDKLFGGNGADTLVGGGGADLLEGGLGVDSYNGGPGSDTIAGLGGVPTKNIPDILDGAPGNPPTPPPIEFITGGSSADRIELKPSSSTQGQFFTAGQTYARITDLNTSEGDFISLPGSPRDYETDVIGLDNESTVLLYKDNPDLDVSLGLFGGVSISPDVALQIPDRTALVAVIDDALVRNLDNTNVYRFDQSV